MAKIQRPNKPLADVNVLSSDKNAEPRKDSDNEVVVCFLADKEAIWGKAEADARAVLALDASVSIRSEYGLGGPWGGDPNYVELVSRKIGEILCDVTKEGKTSMLYWALDHQGDKLEQIGEFSSEGCKTVKLGGPKKEKWGKDTKILPPIKNIVESHFDNAEATMGVIVTDGIIADEAEAMAYCMELGKRLVTEGKTEMFKLVLIGVGAEVDKDQLERFDNMFEDTDLEDDVDIWSHGVAANMEDESDILSVLFGEMMSEDTIIADSGKILDGSGNELKSFPDGMPGKFRFILPKGETSFTVHTPKGDVTQDVSEVF